MIGVECGSNWQRGQMMGFPWKKLGTNITACAKLSVTTVFGTRDNFQDLWPIASQFCQFIRIFDLISFQKPLEDCLRWWREGGWLGVRLFYGSIVGGWVFPWWLQFPNPLEWVRTAHPLPLLKVDRVSKKPLTISSIMRSSVVGIIPQWATTVTVVSSKFSGEKKTNFSGRNKWHWCENWAVYLYPAKIPMDLASYGWLAGQRHPLYTLMMMSAIGMKDQGWRELQHTVGRPLAGLPARPLTLLLACLVLRCLSGGWGHFGEEAFVEFNCEAICKPVNFPSLVWNALYSGSKL